MGEYLGRIFHEIKPRPMYIVEEHVGAGAGAETRPGAGGAARAAEGAEARA